MGKCEPHVELGVEGLPGRLRRWLAQYLEVAENLSTKTRSCRPVHDRWSSGSRNRGVAVVLQMLVDPAQFIGRRGQYADVRVRCLAAAHLARPPDFLRHLAIADEEISRRRPPCFAQREVGILCGGSVEGRSKIAAAIGALLCAAPLP